MGYTAKDSGIPCWYELGSSDPDADQKFYEAVLGWSIMSAGMEGMDYRLANDANGIVAAGIFAADGGMPTGWHIYYEVADTDKTVEAITKAGGSTLVEPSDIPGTGRFSMVADPQGARFGLLAPAPMGDAPEVGAFAPGTLGHGAWQELTTTDLAASLVFYTEVLPWSKGEAVDMGDQGTYQLVQAGGEDVCGMMQGPPDQAPAWMPYFQIESAEASAAAITKAGGTVCLGPMEVPGGEWIVMASDPQGSMFGVVGKK